MGLALGKLIFNPEKDFEELKKFDFRYFDDCGQYKFIERNIDGETYIYINKWNRKIIYKQDSINDNICLIKLYDLIKANLVVKE